MPASASDTVTCGSGAKSSAAPSVTEIEFHEALFQDAEFHEALFHEALFHDALFQEADAQADEFHDALLNVFGPGPEFHETEFHDAPSFAALFHDAESNVYVVLPPAADVLTNWSSPAFGFGAKSGPIAL